MVGNELCAVFVPPGVVVDGLTGTRRVPALAVWFVSPGYVYVIRSLLAPVPPGV